MENFKPFELINSKASKSAIKRLSKVSSIPIREASPVRGCFRKWYGRDEYLYEKLYKKWVSNIIDMIPELVLSTDSAEGLITWETFQSTQKGPCAPVSLQIYKESILDDFNIDQIQITEDRESAIMELSKVLINYYLSKGVYFSPNSINFSDAWKALPNTTFRGYPYHAKGSVVDEEIIRLGGSTIQTAWKFFDSLKGYLLFPGFRISGSPLGKPGKLRVIFMPPVQMQYLEQGISYVLKEKFSQTNHFVGWLSPKDKNEKITRIIHNAKNDGITMIQLDYSRYDKHWHPIFQNTVIDIISNLAVDSKDIMDKWRSKYKELLETQGVFLPDLNNKIKYWKLPYQWASGKIFTQLGGSLINVLLQMLIWREMNWGEFPLDYTFVLGDDACFPIPNYALEEHSYQHLLEKISDILGKYGFKLNPTKAYPNEDLAFLQKYYKPDLSIIGAGSFTRSLASFIWKEKLNKRIEGVQRYWALDIISQIMILSEPFSYSQNNIHGVADYIVREWLKIDSRLLKVINYYKTHHSSFSANGLFEILIKFANVNYDQLLEFMNKTSYDHSGLSNRLQEDDKGKSFPILNYLLKYGSASSNEDYSDILKYDSGEYGKESDLLVDTEILSYGD